MAAQHERWVVELLDGLSSRQRDQLVELLGVLKLQIGRRIGPRDGSGPAGAGS
jgi:hypothetical protein